MTVHAFVHYAKVLIGIDLTKTRDAAMIFDSMLPELEDFRKIEQSLPLRWAPEFGRLVVFGENENRPIHNWFRFKEGFSADLLGMAIGERAKSPFLLLDPFAGSSTSLLSAQLLNRPSIEAVGIEANPFLHMVGNAKLSWHQIVPQEMLRLGAAALKRANALDVKLPRLSSITTGRCISRHVAAKLVAIRDALGEVEQPYKNCLLLGLASCIESLSKIRKDGRALRLVDRARQNVHKTISARWSAMAEDIIALKGEAVRPANQHVFLGDGRRPLSFVGPGTVDLVLTSPPYPNNIDYSEVYKLELWMLGFVDTPGAFRALRKTTLRSHQSSALGEKESAFEAKIIEGALKSHFSKLLERSLTLGEQWRQKLVRSYFADTWNCLQELFQSVKPGGRVFWIVANSLHGSAKGAFLIPADLLSALLAKDVGFELQEILVTRTMKRRLSGNHFLRESVIVMRKPANE